MKKATKLSFGRQLVIARLRYSIRAGREVRMAEIAKKLGVTPGFLHGLEHGRKHPSVEMLAKIVKLYPSSKAELYDALNLE